jgi:hypothetical protein
MYHTVLPLSFALMPLSGGPGGEKLVSSFEYFPTCASAYVTPLGAELLLVPLVAAAGEAAAVDEEGEDELPHPATAADRPSAAQTATVRPRLSWVVRLSIFFSS